MLAIPLIDVAEIAALVAIAYAFGVAVGYVVHRIAAPKTIVIAATRTSNTQPPVVATATLPRPRPLEIDEVVRTPNLRTTPAQRLAASIEAGARAKAGSEAAEGGEASAPAKAMPPRFASIPTANLPAADTDVAPPVAETAPPSTSMAEAESRHTAPALLPATLTPVSGEGYASVAPPRPAPEPNPAPPMLPEPMTSPTGSDAPTPVAPAPPGPSDGASVPLPESKDDARPVASESPGMRLHGGYGAPSPLSAPRAGGRDNLKLIKGIGPRIEKGLNDLGVFHFDQIAAWDRKTVLWVENHFSFPGRIGREKWIAQAADLAQGSKPLRSVKINA